MDVVMVIAIVIGCLVHGFFLTKVVGSEDREQRRYWLRTWGGALLWAWLLPLVIVAGIWYLVSEGSKPDGSRSRPYHVRIKG